MKDNAALILALLVLLMIAAIWSTLPPSPDNVIPNSGKVVGSLRSAKDSTEALAHHAKQHFRPFRMRDGALRFSNARAAHNAAIARMIVALGEPADSLPQDELDKLLANADSKRAVFYDWYNSTIGGPDDTTGETEATSAVDPIEIVSILSDWLKLQQELNRDQREALRRELNECKWRDWGQL
jgi:hypothetical protein